MGRYCRICGNERPNEAFSAKGHQRRVCKRCMPRASEFDADEEICRFLTQSHITAKNIARLRQVAASADSNLAEWAAVILEVALAAPYKRHRLKRLARQHPDLLARLAQCGLLEKYLPTGGAEPADENEPSALPIDNEMLLTDGPPCDLEADEEPW